MIDFTSALYLGMQHPSRSLQPWNQLTLGMPAALAEPPGAGNVAHALSELLGCEQAVLMPSTLHLFWDLFGMLGKQPVNIFLDESTYAIARWGSEQAVPGGAAIYRFRHHDPQSLFSQIVGQTCRNRYPVVVADGYCPACGEPAPIGDYLDIVRRFDGLLVLDDTQSLGILGEKPRPHAPYGNGGGGVLRWSGHAGPDILLGSSLAKGFGVPIAVLAGSKRLVRRFTAISDTRVHCSPPSVAVIQAAAHALALNRDQGDRLRLRLAQRIGHFRKGLELIGCSSTGGLFPAQTLSGIAGASAVRLHQYLARLGLQAILSQPHNDKNTRLSFLITARHSDAEIDRCIELLNALVNGAKTPTDLRPMPERWRYSPIQEVNHESRSCL